MTHDDLAYRRLTVALTLIAVTWAMGALWGCASRPPVVPHREQVILEQPVRSVSGIAGTVTYEDGTPAAVTSLMFTALASGAQVGVVSDRAGAFTAPIAPGEYALAATSDHGFAWIEKQLIASDGFTVRLTKECKPVAGRVVAAGGPAGPVNFGRRSAHAGDLFIANPSADGTFSLCLVPGSYVAFMAGGMLSLTVQVTVPTSDAVILHGYTPNFAKSEPKISKTVAHDIDGVIADVVSSGARLIGLGEATHGCAEFVAMRAKLTFELARRAELRLVLLENDAIAAIGLDRYVNGEDVDLPAQVVALGFWMTDTYEFLRFVEDIRAYNLALAATTARIRIWGIDVQNTKHPVDLLIANAQALRLTNAEQELLRTIATNGAKAAKQLSAGQRAALDALLVRLSSPAGSGELHTQTAVAARSLALQVGFLDDGTEGTYRDRRDAGMAQIASFVVERTGAKRAALWAHNDHVARGSGGRRTMGTVLSAAFFTKYYPVGFFLWQGSSRAWDTAQKIGVIPHALPPAPPFTIEGALMAATGSPEVAWMPLRRLPAALREWFAVPRFAREIGAVYNGEDRTMFLVDPSTAFDALVVIKTVHDSSPTPTGVRKVTK